MFVKDNACLGFQNFGDEIFHNALYASSAEFCVILLTIGIAATEVCQFQQDQGEQARYGFFKKPVGHV